jgi:hypothetical protein
VAECLQKKAPRAELTHWDRLGFQAVGDYWQRGVICGLRVLVG